jgi:hypothetical protein
VWYAELGRYSLIDGTETTDAAKAIKPTQKVRIRHFIGKLQNPPSYNFAPIFHRVSETTLSMNSSNIPLLFLFKDVRNYEPQGFSASNEQGRHSTHFLGKSDELRTRSISGASWYNIL